MKTNLYSFIDIFNNEFQADKDTVRLKEIVIPIIQRDYAQGRQSPDIDRVRERFLDSLHEAITEKPITLDFIYGDINEDGVMYPLDGQQRLTTLFLLHWYAAKKEMIPETEYDFLLNFSYETRYINTQHIFLGEDGAAVHNDDVITVFKYSDVFSDLVNASQRQNFQFRFC